MKRRTINICAGDTDVFESYGNAVIKFTEYRQDIDTFITVNVTVKYDISAQLVAREIVRYFERKVQVTQNLIRMIKG